MNRISKLLPGVLLCALLAAAAWGGQWLEIRRLHQPLIEALVMAILLGMLWRNLAGAQPALKAGADFCAKPVLELAVLLLGGTMNLRDLAQGGPRLLAAIALGVGCTILFSAFVSRRLFGLERKPATLIAVGNSICGNSAIAAVAPVIGASAAEVAGAIAFTAVVGVAVVLTLPLLIPLFGLNHYQYGVLAGMTVYAVPQVLAASFPVSELSGQTGTLVKLVRVLLLGPVVIWFSLTRHDRSTGRPKLSQLVPWFITGFMVLVLLRSGGVIPAALAKWLKEISKLLTIAAMAALGLGVDLKALRAAGAKTTGAVIVSLLFLISLSLALIKGLRIGA